MYRLLKKDNCVQCGICDQILMQDVESFTRHVDEHGHLLISEINLSKHDFIVHKAMQGCYQGALKLEKVA